MKGCGDDVGRGKLLSRLHRKGSWRKWTHEVHCNYVSFLCGAELFDPLRYGVSKGEEISEKRRREKQIMKREVMVCVVDGDSGERVGWPMGIWVL